MTQVVVGLVLEYRKPALTRSCVESLLREGCSAVVVWDNSNDGGVSRQALYAAFRDDPRVALVGGQANSGFAGGVRRGIDHIACEHAGAWVLLVNNDATLLPGALAALRATLQARPEAVLAYPDVRHGGRVVGPMFYHRRLALVLLNPWPGAFAYASGSLLLVAPQRLAGPLFDEDFFMYGEDVELGWRLGGAGSMAYLPRVLGEHLGSQGSGAGSLRYETWLVRSHWLLARKLAHSPGDAALNLLGRMLSLPARAVLRSLRYRSLIPLRALVRGTMGPRHTTH